MRTFDVDFINSIMRHPSVYYSMADDGSPQPEDFDVYSTVKNFNVLFLSPNRYTVFMLVPVNTITYDLHTCILPVGRGDLAFRAVKEMLSYAFAMTNCYKIISYVPENNKAALVFGLRAGFKKEGFIKDSYLKNGLLLGQYLVGISRGDVCQQ